MEAHAMQYKSTRNAALRVTAAQAIAQGISDEGGLFVPETFPAPTSMHAAARLCRPRRIRARALSDGFYRRGDRAVRRARLQPGKIRERQPGESRSLDAHGENKHVLELWHGPTCAFKDMALQILPHLLTKSLSKTADGKTAVILVATSGDTGKAALEGFRDVAGTEMIVFYPENGVSPMQKRQMDTQEGENLCVCAIEGNFRRRADRRQAHLHERGGKSGARGAQ
jgi:threonine synthase